MVIGASEGTEVKAIATRGVILADWLQVVRSGGWWLQHGKGDMSLYGYHQSALVERFGSQVGAGQPIALVGSSGGQGSAFTLISKFAARVRRSNPQPWLGRSVLFPFRS